MCDESAVVHVCVEASLEFCAVMLHDTSKGNCGDQCEWDDVLLSSEFSERLQVRCNIRC